MKKIAGFYQFLMFSFLYFSAFPSNASAFSKLTESLEQWKIEFYALLSVFAFFYVMSVAIKAKIGQAQWSDVGVAVFQVGVVGSMSAAVPFAWSFWAA